MKCIDCSAHVTDAPIGSREAHIDSAEHRLTCRGSVAQQNAEAEDPDPWGHKQNGPS